MSIDAALSLSKLRDENRALKQRNRELLTALRRERTLRTAILDLKEHMPTATIPPLKPTGESECIAVLVASDWHVEERIEPHQVHGLNAYNPDIARARATQFFQNGLRLIDIFAKDTQIDRVVLALLGDFLTNDLHEDAAETNYLPPMDAVLFAQELLTAGLQYLLDHSSYQFTIVCHSGNHGRTTQRVRWSTESGHSLEYFMYQAMAQRFPQERITWHIPTAYHFYLSLFDDAFTIRFHHGHAQRYYGGVSGITLPVNKSIAQWNKAKRADIDCFGHFHQLMDGGRFIANGSLIGYSPYAVAIKAEFEPPRQVCFLVDRDHGKTIVAPVLLER